MSRLKASHADNNVGDNVGNDLDNDVHQDVVIGENKDAHNSTYDNKDIAALAYFLWMDRGCPDGSPDQDWFQAEELVMTSQRSGPKSF